MKIEKIKKMAGNAYKIYLEDGMVIKTYDQIIIDYKLLFLKEIDDDTLERINKDNEYYELYNNCVKQLSHKMKSKKEIEVYLKKYTDNNDDINKIINKLVSIKLINDNAYAVAYINDKINFSTLGPLKIKAYLLEQNIDEKFIDDNISRVNKQIFIDRINKYIIKQNKSNKSSVYQFKLKVLNYLINKGYEKEMIVNCLNNIDIEEDITSDYNKIYNKLSKKYHGYELDNKVKTKLYQKGYSKDKIDSVIKKSG